MELVLLVVRCLDAVGTDEVAAATEPDTEREDARLCDINGTAGTLNFDRSLASNDPVMTQWAAQTQNDSTICWANGPVQVEVSA